MDSSSKHRLPRALGAVVAVGALAMGAQASTGAASRKAPPTTYAVKKGDTLGAIARKAKVSVGDLAAWNGITNVNLIHVGQQLVLTAPAGAAKPSAGDNTAKAPSKAGLDPWGMTPLPSPVVISDGGPRKMLVQKGDTWNTLAQRAGIPTADLLKLNHKTARSKLIANTTVTVPGSGWICPVANAKYSFIDSWGSPRPGGRRHLGTDIFARPGSSVVAPVGGSVRYFPNNLGGLAMYLTGDDGNTYYLAHFAQLIAPDHSRVEAGGVLGLVGNTGDAESTPSHVHVELKPHGGPSVNSYFTVKKWCG